MGKVIALLQKKGGAAKTTTAINLLGILLEKGFSAVLCDMDREKPDACFWADNGDDLVEHVIPLIEENPTKKIGQLKAKHDFVLIDTPPNFEAAALKAAMLCDITIIPCSSSLLDRNALEDAAACAMMANKPYIFLASRVMKRTKGTNDLLAELKSTGTSFSTYITNNVAMLDCQKSGTWVGKYAPQMLNHKQYNELANELLEFLGVPV